MSESVLLTTDAPSLQFENEKRQAQFELGVACAVFLWDDLSTAVASGWGGPESAAKREWLAGAIVDLFDGQEVATEDIEYRLLTAMIDEFDVTIETGTAFGVAQQIIQVYQECAEDNFTLVQSLFTRFQQHQPAQQVTVKDDDDEDDNEEHDDEMVDEDDDMVDAVETEPKTRIEPEVDEDGFTIVKRR